MTGQRTPAIWLRDILDACRQVSAYVARGRAAFDSDPALLDAIVFRLVTIGEAAKALQQQGVHQQFPALPWSAMSRTRDRITHHYFRISPNIIWDTATTDIPEVERAAAEALATMEKRQA